MITMIAAALAAAAQTAPAPPAANPHAQHQQAAPQQGHAQHGQMDHKADGCACCKEKMKTMHSEHRQPGAHNHPEQRGH